ncbi:MAG: leucine-rich repeat protein [Eubacterium sp.]|nr:leucine-rich repeat protein [Eubacterium sp.]
MGRMDNGSEYYLNNERISRVSLVRTILMTVIFIAVFTVGLKNASIVVRAEEPTVNGVTLTERIKQGWDNYETEINLVNYRVPSEDFINYYHSAFFSDSKYFYVGFEKVSMFTNFDGTVYSVKVEYISDDAEYLKSMIAQYNNAMDKCISGMDKSWSDLEKLIYINDYLVGLCEYDLNADHRYDAYGALVGHKAVCQGYSMAFKALAEKVGIPCYIVSSDQKNHAWNIVKLNGRFYMLDVTWNDVSENTLGYQKYKFFLKSENWFKSEYGEHCADDYEIHGAKVTPVADDNYYDDYFWSSAGSGLYIYLKFVDGQWYGTDGAGKIIKYSCNGKDMTAEEGAIVDLSQVFWWIPGEHQGYYAVTAMKIASYGKNLLYSTPKQIMMYDSETGKATPVYTLTDEEQAVGCIYGIYVTNDGNIEYLVSKSLRSADLEAGTTKTVPVTYKATFDWSEDCSEATVKISSYPIESFSTTIPNVSSSVVLEDATCTETGLATYTVSVDYIGTTYTETKEKVIEAKGHKEVKDVAVAPTCTNTGLTEGSHCSVCKMVIKRQETIDAVGHDWDEGVITTPSTCKSKGEKTFTCKREGCNATRKEEVPFADHIQGNPVRENEVAVSCTSSGSYDEVIYCTICKAELSREKKDVAVIGHSWDEGTVTTPAGCTTDGVKTFRCTRPGCNETKNETIKAQGHKVVIDRAVVPTYTSTGLTEGSHCSKCKTVLVRQEIVPKLVSSDNGNQQNKPDTNQQNKPDTNQQNNPSGGNQPANPENGNNPGNKVTKPGVGTISADGKALTDTEGIRYFVSEKLTSADVKNNIKVADQRAGLKYKITKITRKRGRIIAGNVTYLGPYNKNCKKAVIPDTIKICGVKFNVTAVNKNAFRKCKKLSKVFVGKNVSSIGEKCFFGCNNLKTVTVKTKRLKTVGKNAFKGINRKAVIRVPKNYIDKYTKLVAKGKAPKGVKVTK